MASIRRTHLYEQMQRALAQPGPTLILVDGSPGSGKTHILSRGLRTQRRAGGGWAPTIGIAASVGPAARQLLQFARTLRDGGIEGQDGFDSWSDAFARLVSHLHDHRSPRAVVIDDVEALRPASPDVSAGLRHLWTSVRAHALPLRLIVSSSEPDAFRALLGPDGPFAGAEPIRIHVTPVSLREVREHLPRWSPLDRFMLTACLGRFPEALGGVDPEVRWSTNVQRLLAGHRAPFYGRPPLRLRASVQKPDRYVGILSALADGAREWAALYRHDPTFTAGSQLGPYLGTLQRMGWVEVERSLDAPARSRKQRYRLTDPMVAFWYAGVERARARLLAGYSPSQVWRTHLASAAEAQAQRWFQVACRAALREAGDQWIGARAREAGGLWGEGYDLPVAGTLRNGAVVYGSCIWGRPATQADARALHRQMRSTRYGYGRATRWRVVFAAHGATEALQRQAARDELLTVLPADALF